MIGMTAHNNVGLGGHNGAEWSGHNEVRRRRVEEIGDERAAGVRAYDMPAAVRVGVGKSDGHGRRRAVGSDGRGRPGIRAETRDSGISGKASQTCHCLYQSRI